MKQLDNTLLEVSRAVHDIRAGACVGLADKHGVLLIAAAELASEATLKSMRKTGGPVRLIITATHARGLGQVTRDKAVAIEVLDAQQVQTIVKPQRRAKQVIKIIKATALEKAALQLVKEAALLPAVLSAPAKNKHSAHITPANISHYLKAQTATLTKVAEAKLPLMKDHNARIVAFRTRFGAVEHLAVIIGGITAATGNNLTGSGRAPASAGVNSARATGNNLTGSGRAQHGATGNKIPLVRVHSSCITGDLLGSLRCDCGDQLALAMDAIAAEGSGVLIYLNQEGRGIGIANKLRAYSLQDAGLDTMEANEALGFDADEREFATAAAILKQLGLRKIRLMTNNPLKISELKRHGITVVRRVPIIALPHTHNKKYLETKEKKAGHYLKSI